MGLTLGLISFSGCTLALPGNTPGVRAAGDKSVDPELQSICDVNRSRVREQLLARYNVAKFRSVALKISKEISQDEIADLVRLEQTRRLSGNHAAEGARGRAELVDEIYTGAILRAGFKPNAVQSIPGTDLSYRIGVDLPSAGQDTYSGFLVGSLSKELLPEGQIAEISLAASPNQARYYIELRQVARYESQPDGTRVPIYAAASLFDAADELVPHYCVQVSSALDLEDFNTIPGLGSPDSENIPPLTPAPAPAPVPAPAPTREPVPAPTAAPVPPVAPVPVVTTVPAPVHSP